MTIRMSGRDWKVIYTNDDCCLPGKWIDANSLVYSVNGRRRNFREDDLCPCDDVDDDDLVEISAGTIRDLGTDAAVGDLMDFLRRRLCRM